MQSYYGGVALSSFNDQYADKSHGMSTPPSELFSIMHSILMAHAYTVHVHMSDLATQTGASLFLQTQSLPCPTLLPNFQSNITSSATGWTYSKIDGTTKFASLTADHRITHLITEITNAGDIKGWKVAGIVNGSTWKMDWRTFADMKAGRLWKGGVVRASERLLQLWTMKGENKLWILERSG